MAPDQGPEPTGWELLRSLDGLKAEVAKVGDRVVPLDVYNADKQGIAERFVRVESRVRDQEQNGQDAEKLKRSQKLTVSLAIASPILAILFNAVSKGFGL
jgi:hypothetical protein